MTHTPRDKAKAFLNIAKNFQLGSLPTEQRHPLTYDLAHLSRHDIAQAINILKGIDLGVVDEVAVQIPALARLKAAIRDTLDAGNRVFLYGCGATGRLSLSLEYIWRYLHKNNPEADQVFGFMSGGDLALVHSIENFEDHPEFGARQLRDVGFSAHDLLICCTEGGETPSVIGATEEATRISSRKPFFLYGNPDDVLIEEVERSRRVLENNKIEKICLFVGSMALSGSTRLQSSTALMLGVGLALFDVKIQDFAHFLRKTDFSFLNAFIEEESRIYGNGDFLLYETDIYGMTILTDTTERAPTFSLLGFENRCDQNRKPSLSFLRFPAAETSAEAWQAVLLRPPVPIEWPELKAVAGHDRLIGFDFSADALKHRQQDIAPHQLHRFVIDRQEDEMRFSLGHLNHTIDVAGLHPLFEQLLLKILLNIHSTLIMGRLGRYESNVMTWVKPSNNKLIDRAIRYVEYLLHHENILDYSYEDICYRLFEEAETMRPDRSVVLLTVEHLRAQHKKQA